MLIQDLPMLMEFQNVDLNEIFNISQIEESSITLNNDQQNQKDKIQLQFNLEQTISNSILKVFGPEDQIVYNPTDFKGMNLTEEEMVEILYEGNKNLTEEEVKEEILQKGKLESEASQVQYTFIYFEEMIRKIQIDLILQRSSKYCDYLQLFKPGKIVKCSHLFLAIIINKCQEVANFFEQNTTQNIVDIQFKFTREEIKKYLIIYVLGFFIPYVYNSLALNDIDNLQDESNIHFIFRWTLYSICSITQLYFLILEIPEIYYNTFQIYISEVYNIFDINLPILFIVHLVLRVIYGKVTGFGWMQLFDNIIEILILIGSTLKLLQYIRYKEEFSYFVQMFFSVLIELIPFLLIFLIFIFVFTVFQIIMGAQVPEQGSDYPGVHQYLRMLFHTFRTSVGDLQVLNYSKWADDVTAENPSFSSIARNLIVALVWAFWIFDIYLILIVMLNLLIAQVGQIYEKIMSQGKTSIYKERAQLNLKVFQTKYYFGELHEFVALIMQTPLQNTESFNFDDFITFTERVKKSTQITVDKMQNNISKEMKQIKSSLENKIGSIENKIDNLVKQMEKVIQNQIEKKEIQMATEQSNKSQIDSQK